jgi:hypothetical protein
MRHGKRQGIKSETANSPLPQTPAELVIDIEAEVIKHQQLHERGAIACLMDAVTNIVYIFLFGLFSNSLSKKENLLKSIDFYFLLSTYIILTTLIKWQLVAWLAQRDSQKAIKSTLGDGFAAIDEDTSIVELNKHYTNILDMNQRKSAFINQAQILFLAPYSVFLSEIPRLRTIIQRGNPYDYLKFGPIYISLGKAIIKYLWNKYNTKQQKLTIKSQETHLNQLMQVLQNGHLYRWKKRWPSDYSSLVFTLKNNYPENIPAVSINSEPYKISFDDVKEQLQRLFIRPQFIVRAMDETTIIIEIKHAMTLQQLDHLQDCFRKRLEAQALIPQYVRNHLPKLNELTRHKILRQWRYYESENNSLDCLALIFYIAIDDINDVTRSVLLHAFQAIYGETNVDIVRNDIAGNFLGNDELQIRPVLTVANIHLPKEPLLKAAVAISRLPNAIRPVKHIAETPSSTLMQPSEQSTSLQRTKKWRVASSVENTRQQSLFKAMPTLPKKINWRWYEDVRGSAVKREAKFRRDRSDNEVILLVGNVPAQMYFALPHSCLFKHKNGIPVNIQEHYLKAMKNGHVIARGTQGFVPCDTEYFSLAENHQVQANIKFKMKKDSRVYGQEKSRDLMNRRLYVLDGYDPHPHISHKNTK